MSSFERSESVLRKQNTRRGLTGILDASTLCTEAVRLYPNMFRAISVRNGTLHIETTPANTMSFKVIEGKLMAELNRFAEGKHLPKIVRIRLTIAESIDSI